MILTIAIDRVQSILLDEVWDFSVCKKFSIGTTMQGKYIGASCERTSPIPSEQPCQNADLAVLGSRFQTFTQKGGNDDEATRLQGQIFPHRRKVCGRPLVESS